MYLNKKRNGGDKDAHKTTICAMATKRRREERLCE